MKFRTASKDDVFGIMRLFQKSKHDPRRASLFVNYRQLESALNDKQSLWIVGDEADAIVSLIHVRIDEGQRLSKINRMLVDLDIPHYRSLLRQTLVYTLDHLKTLTIQLEVIYTTTLSMTLEEQNITASEGFKVLGVFPNALGEDNSKLNGLTAYFYPDVLQKKRQVGWEIHPSVAPFYRLSAEQCELADIKVATEADIGALVKSLDEHVDRDFTPQLELIRASGYAQKKYADLLSKNSQVSNFYPFYQPNCLVTDPAQHYEVFIHLDQRNRFAAILGERIRRPIHPQNLYTGVLKLLRDNNVSYVEIINDAADLAAIEYIIRSGFAPCAFFPAFKKQGPFRRDFVIFGRTYEYLSRPTLDINPTYIDFFVEYYNCEMERNFPGSNFSEAIRGKTVAKE